MIEHGNLRVDFRVKFSVDINLRVFDACCPTRSTLDCGLDYSLGARLVNFGFV
jgi:hypothetical protein